MAASTGNNNHYRKDNKVFDKRSTLSRKQAKKVYENFAKKDHPGGKDASSSYGGPAIRALLSMASFYSLPNMTVLDYGCGQGKLAELVLTSTPSSTTEVSNNIKSWHGVDQSPLMIIKAKERLNVFTSSSSEDNTSPATKIKFDLLPDGDPKSMEHIVRPHTIDRFVSTYCLDLLSEQDIYAVLDEAERVLHPERGLLLLAGITRGYGGILPGYGGAIGTLQTFFMTLLWEFMYLFFREKVGGCRVQNLEPYLVHRGWTIVNSVRTLPNGFPHMVSEVVAARPPLSS